MVWILTFLVYISLRLNPYIVICNVIHFLRFNGKKRMLLLSVIVILIYTFYYTQYAFNFWGQLQDSFTRRLLLLIRESKLCLSLSLVPWHSVMLKCQKTLRVITNEKKKRTKETGLICFYCICCTKNISAGVF